MANYLDTTGLQSLWTKIKSAFAMLAGDNTFTGSNTFKKGVQVGESGKDAIGMVNPSITITDSGIKRVSPVATSTDYEAYAYTTDGDIYGLGSLARHNSLAFADLTDKPTTLAGYGITDGVNTVSTTGTGNAITGISISDHKLTATKGSTFLTTTAASSTYLTKTSASSTYLPLAGGTVTGNLLCNGYISAASVFRVAGNSTMGVDSTALRIGYGWRTTRDINMYGKSSISLRINTTEKASINSTGLAVTGTITATGAISGNSSSDERKKENIVEANSLAELSTLGGVYDFDYKETGEHSTGFIAQKVQEGIFSDIVTEDADGYKQINYWSPKLVAAAIGAIGQLQKRVEELEAEVAKLKG